MAIDKIYFDYMMPLIEKIGNNRSLRIACLSYPDLLLSPKQIANLLGSDEFLGLEKRADSSDICRWHGIDEGLAITETRAFFTLLGHEVDFFDVKAFRGYEIILDLNKPISEKHRGKYDVVLDTGTLEHCFNVGQAFMGMCELVKVDGVVLTQAPLSKVNHGFWNFSPCAYQNFFDQNNWQTMFLHGYFTDKGQVKKFKPSINGRFIPPPESILIACARRGAESTYDLPIQEKYIKSQV